MSAEPSDKANIGKYTLPDIRLIAAVIAIIFTAGVVMYFIVSAPDAKVDVKIIGQIDITLIYGALIGTIVSLLGFLSGRNNAAKKL